MRVSTAMHASRQLEYLGTAMSDVAMKFCIEQLVSLKVPPAVPLANLVGDAFGKERKSVDV